MVMIATPVELLASARSAWPAVERQGGDPCGLSAAADVHREPAVGGLLRGQTFDVRIQVGHGDRHAEGRRGGATGDGSARLAILDPDVEQIGRAHVGTPVTWPSRMPSSA